MTPQQKEYIDNSKRLYESLKGKSFFCPAIKSDVLFTNLGWQHLAHKKGGRRFADIFRRIKLLAYVESTIKKANSYEKSKINKNCFIIYGKGRKLENRSWKKVRVGVNIVLNKNGEYIFFSVF